MGTSVSRKEEKRNKNNFLMVSYNIIKNHRGRVYVESKVGEGTVFHIILPLLQNKDTTDLV
jgi:signal transduction histidine kinase